MIFSINHISLIVGRIRLWCYATMVGTKAINWKLKLQNVSGFVIDELNLQFLVTIKFQTEKPKLTADYLQHKHIAQNTRVKIYHLNHRIPLLNFFWSDNKDLPYKVVKNKLL